MLKKVLSPLVPEGLLVLAVVAVIRMDALHVPADYARMCGYIVFAAGLLLAWRFHRSRLLLALLVLAAAQVVLGYSGGEATSSLAYGLIVLFLPLNFAALAFIPERGIMSRAGGMRLGVFMIQMALFAPLVWPESAAAAQVFGRDLVPLGMIDLLQWTPTGTQTFMIFLVAAAAIAVRLVWRSHPVDRGFFWALAAAAVAFLLEPSNANGTLYLSTSGLCLIIGEIEASHFMAYRDGLTGLPSRRALNEALPRLGRQYAIAMVDVDRFKKFNDKYGHDIGDQVLRMVAARLRSAKGRAKAFRYGGEEFALIFPRKSADDALEHLERVREEVERDGFTLRGPNRPGKKPKKRKKNSAAKSSTRRRKTVKITVSIGVADRDSRDIPFGHVIKDADSALYKAKKKGRNRIVRA